jgi:hypothetical protein
MQYLLVIVFDLMTTEAGMSPVSCVVKVLEKLHQPRAVL